MNVEEGKRENVIIIVVKKKENIQIKNQMKKKNMEKVYVC